jgi:UPF0271 protein
LVGASGDGGTNSVLSRGPLPHVQGALTIDLNADAGESFGRWGLGCDEELMPLVTSVNVACGFHAGDATTMRKACVSARAYDVALGAHPGLPDMLGFGRREMNVAASDVFDYCAYQIGALIGVAASESVRVEHVKPHGALYTMAADNLEIAEAIARCVIAVDDSLILILSAGAAADAAQRAGARIAREAFVDLDYDEDGRLLLEPIKQARDPDVVSERAVAVAQGSLTTVSASKRAVDADTICLHGDGPNVIALAQAVRSAFRSNGISVMRLRDVLSAREQARLASSPGQSEPQVP